MIKRLLGILSIALLIFAFMFGVMTPSGYCMGDNIIRALGFKAWSMENAKHSAITVFDKESSRQFKVQ